MVLVRVPRLPTHTVMVQKVVPKKRPIPKKAVKMLVKAKMKGKKKR